MINLATLANKYRWRLGVDGDIRIPFNKQFNIEIYVFDDEIDSICIYTLKGTLWLNLLRLGGVTIQEGDNEVVVKLASSSIDQATELIKASIH